MNSVSEDIDAVDQTIGSSLFAECPIPALASLGFFSFQDDCYRVHENKVPWHEAERICQMQSDAHVASVHEKEEVSHFSEIAVHFKKSLWIGAQDHDDTSPFNVSLQECAYINHQTRMWESADCNEKHSFVCKHWSTEHILGDFERHLQELAAGQSRDVGNSVLIKR